MKPVRRTPCTATFAGLAALAGLAAFAALAFASAASSENAVATPRIEARSADLLAVGVVREDRMTIHLSRLIDNAPVRDAAISVLLRGTQHAATAEADGSYTLQSKDLQLPGAAAVRFEVARGDLREELKGTLEVAGNEPTDKNSARQLWWWVLNFSVCTGFLWLIARRRKAAGG